MRFFAFLIMASLPLIGSQPAFAAEPIGRLFTTPAERSNLDYLRQSKKNISIKTDMAIELAAEPEPIELPDAINMQGYVKRNDGKQGTVWINNKALQENTGNKDVVVGKLPRDGNRVPIRLPANGKRLTLKAGQVYDPENNQVREARAYASQGDTGRIGDEDTP
ncbi:MAG: hypothetical protein ACT4OH_08130 [Methylophilaceae bacterium]